MATKEFNENHNLNIALSYCDGDVQELLDGVLKTHSDIATKCSEQISTQYVAEFKLLDMANACLASLLLIVSDREAHDVPTVWAKNPRNGALYFLAFLKNIDDSIFALRNLTLTGHGSQSRNLLRYLVETCDVTLACAGDQNMFNAFCSVPDDEVAATRHWRQALAPSKVRECLTRIEHDLFASDEVLKAMTNEMRRSTYDWLSKFSHVDLVAYLAHISSDSGVVMAEGTLNAATMYLYLFLITFRKLLLDRHEWFNRDTMFTRPEARQCDVQEKTCFVMIQRYQEAVLQHRHELGLEPRFDRAVVDGVLVWPRSWDENCETDCTNSLLQTGCPERPE